MRCGNRPQLGSLKYEEPWTRAFVASGSHPGLARSAHASTTASAFVAHEIVKPKPPGCTPNCGPSVRISGFGSHHGLTRGLQKVSSHPVVPGKQYRSAGV